jgi:hypothetical protein
MVIVLCVMFQTETIPLLLPHAIYDPEWSIAFCNDDICQLHAMPGICHSLILLSFAVDMSSLLFSEKISASIVS